MEKERTKADAENSYSNILKRIGAFGGVQIFNILLNLIRGKFVAILLGPGGMGISSLYTGASNTMQQFAGLGLNLAMVKEIAASKDNGVRLKYILRIIIFLIVAISLFGLLICMLPASLWSTFTFGNNGYTGGFIWLSVAVAFSIAGTGYLAILQGLGYVRLLARASLVGGIAGLVGGVPLYYFYGDKGIVPAMIILAVTLFIFYYMSTRKAVKKETADNGSYAYSLTWRRSLPMVKKLISIGFILMIGTLAGTLVNYLINLYIRSNGGIDDVGFFQAASSLTNQYIGLIFSALALDYFPRLSSIATIPSKLRMVVNRQTEIVMLVASPLLILLILTTPLIIKILLADTFMRIIPLMKWLGLGMCIQALAFPLGYIYVARDDRKAYLMLEVIWANICWIVCSVIFYSMMGLEGLGVSLVVRGTIDLVINYAVCFHRYGFNYDTPTLILILANVMLTFLAFAASFLSGISGYIITSLILIFSVVYSIRILRHKFRKESQ